MLGIYQSMYEQFGYFRDSGAPTNRLLRVCTATSGGPVFIVDGITAPATTTLTLQFKETVLMTKEKIREGY